MGRTACTEPQCLYNGYRVFPRSKERPGRDADPSPPSSAVGHERVELYLYSPYGQYGLYRSSVPVQEWPLPSITNTDVKARPYFSSVIVRPPSKSSPVWYNGSVPPPSKKPHTKKEDHDIILYISFTSSYSSGSDIIHSTFCWRSASVTISRRRRSKIHYRQEENHFFVIISKTDPGNKMSVNSLETIWRELEDDFWPTNNYRADNRHICMWVTWRWRE